MLQRIHSLLLFLFSILSISSFSQDKPAFKFGKISPDDFKQSLPAFDTGAHAIILGDVGFSRIVGSNDGWFGYEFERKIRVYIVDKAGVEAGKFEIPLYSSSSSDMREEIRRFNGVTYNLENGKVVETKLDSKEIFTEKISKNRSDKKFSMPALREGSIFELSYLLKSDYLFQFREWAFQHPYPVLWSEYEIEMPIIFDFVHLTQGYHPYHINSTKEVPRNYHLRTNNSTYSYLTGPKEYDVSTIALQRRWVMKELPALKSESYITSLENYRSKIEFQLASIRLPDQTPNMIMENWPKVTAD